MEKKNKKERQRSSDERTSPLQDLNNRILPKTNTKKKKNVRICSSSISIEAPKGCLRSLLSSHGSHSNPSSSSSSSSSHLQRKPKSFSTTTNGNKPIATTSKSAPHLARPGSKPCNGNYLPKPSSLRSKKNTFLLPQWQSSKKPTSKASQRSNLSAVLSNSVKNPAYESERFRVNQKDLEHKLNQKEGHGLGELTDFNFSVPDNLNNFENFTPVSKLACGLSLNQATIDDKPVGEDSNSANSTVKTPPVEASVSPEIQCGSSNVVLVSATTPVPVCYGAGHHISGVTDKRKCRPRGILTIGGGPSDSSGFGNISAFEDDNSENAENVRIKSRTSLIPLPAEASMRWLSSPLSNEDEVQKDDSSNSHRPLVSTSICDLASPSSCCQFPSDLVSSSGDENGNGNSDAMTSTGKTRIVLLSPRRTSSCQGLSESSFEEKVVGSSSTPQTKSSCKTVGLPYYSLMGEEIPTSIGNLSCRNVVQTPNSITSSERHVDISWKDAHSFKRNDFSSKPVSLSHGFQREGLSPRSQMSMCDPLGLGSQLTNLGSPSHSTDAIQLNKDSNTCASWISDSTLGNVSLSQMRISWREGLASRIFDMDAFDCCRCLSDEENNGDGSNEFKHKSLQAFAKEDIDSLTNDGLRSPEFLEQEPQILRRDKEMPSPVEHNICAESISIDADGLVASGDSDWTLCYKNHLFRV